MLLLALKKGSKWSKSLLLRFPPPDKNKWVVLYVLRPMFLHTPEEVLPALTCFGKNFPFAGTKRKKKHK